MVRIIFLSIVCSLLSFFQYTDYFFSNPNHRIGRYDYERISNDLYRTNFNREKMLSRENRQDFQMAAVRLNFDQSLNRRFVVVKLVQ